MKKRKELILVLLIFILALFLRFFRIAKSPPSLDWDEVSIGWNAYTIFKTRRDEFGTRLPLAFRSFGDYKSPLLIYLTAPVVGFFGRSIFTVRFISVFLGSLSVIVFYFLVRELISPNSLTSEVFEDSTSEVSPLAKLTFFAPGARDNPNYSLLITHYLPIIASLLLAISPWHLQFSRPAFEPNIALFFVLLGTWMFLKALKKPMFYVPSSIFYCLSLYSYHSPKLFLPFFLLGLVIIYRKELFSRIVLSSPIPERDKMGIVLVGMSLILGVVMLWPLVKLHFTGEGASRFSGTSVFYTEKGEKKNFDLKLGSEIVKNYFSHFSPAFLFFGDTRNPRIKLKNYGLLHLIELPFLLIGFYSLIKQKDKKWAKLVLLWILAGPVPASIGRMPAHSVRSFNMLPPLIIAVAIGLLKFIDWLKSKKFAKKGIFGLFILYTLFIILYSYEYHFRYPVYAAPDWQYGYRQMAEYVKEREADVDKIIITSAYGQPHTFTYFWQKRDPMEIFWGQMVKYTFRDIKWEEDKLMENVLLVGTPEQISMDAIPMWERDSIEKEILFPDGEVAFRIVRR